MLSSTSLTTRQCHVLRHAVQPFKAQVPNRSRRKQLYRAAKEELLLTPPLVIQVEETLCPPEPTATPKWSTFMSHVAGDWVGQSSAFTPWEGGSEPVWLDDDGNYCNHVFCRSIESRESIFVEEGASLDVYVKRLARTASKAALDDLKISSDVLDEDAGKSLNLDVEFFPYNSEGAVIFDGGSYCTGPEYIGTDFVNEDEDEDGGRRGTGADEDEDEDGFDANTWVVESSLCTRGSSRIRMKLTCKSCLPPGAELELEPMRLLLFHEQWSGPVGTLPVRTEQLPVLDTPLPEQRRGQPADFTGRWKVFSIVARPTQDIDYDTGEDAVVVVYNIQEELQLWKLPDDDTLQEEEGAALWLPPGVLVSIKMVQVASDATNGQPSSPQDLASSNGTTKLLNTPRGISISFAYVNDDGTIVSLDRLYDSEGFLHSVQYNTALKV